jgi:hypothetical protein
MIYMNNCIYLCPEIVLFKDKMGGGKDKRGRGAGGPCVVPYYGPCIIFSSLTFVNSCMGKTRVSVVDAGISLCI